MTAGIGLILRAAVFAADRHRGQVRKGVGGAPYIQHPVAVALALAEEGGVTDPELIAAGLLHDTIEDTPTVHDDLADAFGERVANLVAELTDDKRLPKQMRKQLQVDHARKLTQGARVVKLADKLCNLREILASPPVGWSEERRATYVEWSKNIVDQIRDSNAELARQFDLVYAKANIQARLSRNSPPLENEPMKSQDQEPRKVGSPSEQPSLTKKQNLQERAQKIGEILVRGLNRTVLLEDEGQIPPTPPTQSSPPPKGRSLLADLEAELRARHPEYSEETIKGLMDTV